MSIAEVRLRPRVDPAEPLDRLLSDAEGDYGPLLCLFDDVRDRDLRGSERRFVVEGERVVRRFLRGRFPCEAILATRPALDRLRPLLATRPSAESIVTFVADEATVTSIAGYRMHGGCLAIGQRPWWPPASADLFDALPHEGRCRLLVAEGVTHVDNLGTLFRNAACFAARGILLDGACADPLLRKPIRFSMGRVFDVPWGVSRDLPADLAQLRRLGLEVVALELADDAIPLGALRERERVAIVVGSEGHGLSPEVRAACTATCAIPAAAPDEDGEARSLNVGVAAAIALYELARSP